MKKITSINDFENLSGNYVVKVGVEFCVPCKIVEDNLSEIELDGDIKLDFYFTDNSDIAQKFSHYPIIILNTSSKKVLDDRDIMMDKDELKNWILDNI